MCIPAYGFKSLRLYLPGFGYDEVADVHQKDYRNEKEKHKLQCSPYTFFTLSDHDAPGKKYPCQIPFLSILTKKVLI